MGLQDLNENIHRRDFRNERETRTAFDPNVGEREGEVGFETAHWDASQVPVRKTLLGRFLSFSARHWPWYLLGLFLFALLVVAVNFETLRAMVFSNDRVSVEIVGPTDVASGETVSYKVVFRNMNVLKVKDAEVVVSFPESFRVGQAEGFEIDGHSMRRSVGEIAPDGSGEVRFSGKFYGSKGSLVYFHPTLRFIPFGVSGAFETGGQTGVTIVSSPLFLEMTAPQEAMSGNEVEYVISYRNDSDLPYSNIRILADYPEDFRFSGSDPRPTEGDDVFRIGNLEPGASGEIRVHGTLYGENNQSKAVAASLGVFQGDGNFLAYETKDRATRMIVSPLSITQTVNGRVDLAAKPGDPLRYELGFVNQGDIGLRDVIVTVELDPTLLDLTRLDLRGGKGFYDAGRQSIVWTAADLPALARLEPGQGGMVSFSVPLRGDIATTGEAGKHLSVRTVAKIDSPDVPFVLASNKVIASNTLEVRVGSEIGFDILGFHTDTPIPNSGPVPPTVGRETTYMLRFRVTNYLNDLTGARVVATLPSGVRCTGVFLPDTEHMACNERTGEVIWDIGTMAGGEKVSRELSFQVAVVPGPDRTGDVLRLLSGAVLEATDTFTEERISVARGEKTTALTEDAGLSRDQYVVVP